MANILLVSPVSQVIIVHQFHLQEAGWCKSLIASCQYAVPVCSIAAIWLFLRQSPLTALVAFFFTALWLLGAPIIVAFVLVALVAVAFLRWGGEVVWFASRE